MTLDEALHYIHAVCWKGSIPGLERISALLDKMGHPERTLKFVHVTGTNGKGSTCAMVASVLRQAGYRTGLYTSPYIFRFNERMQIDGQPIPDDARQTRYAAPPVHRVDVSQRLIDRHAAGLLWYGCAAVRC